MKNLQSFEEFLNESRTRTPEQVDKEKRNVIKLAKEAAKDLIKSNPAKAGYYKAKIQYLEAKLTTLDAYKQMLNKRQ